MTQFRFILFTLALAISFGFVGDAAKPLPKYVGFVNDFENLLTSEQERYLTQIIAAHEKKTGNEIVVVTVNDFYGYQNIVDFSLELANAWEVGKKDKNNGVLLVVSKYWSGVRIENGYGIVQKLTNAETKEILEKDILPHFRSEFFYEGIRDGVEAIILEIK